MDHRVDYTAAGTMAAAPAWVPFVNQINVALTFISLVLGLAFLLWRWHRAAKEGPVE